MSRYFLEWLCGTPLVWQFDEKVRKCHCERRFSQRGNLEAIYFGSSPMRVGNVGPLARLIPLPVLLRKLRILVFFLHRRSQRRADMPYCLPFLPVHTAAPCALTLRTRRHDVWFSRLFSGHVKRGRCSRDAGRSGKSQANAFDVPLRRVALTR